jgi:hypothetical protein
MSGAVPEEPPLFDAEGALSREFLLHRGYCCENGCRNCPYGFRKPAPPHEPPQDSGETSPAEQRGIDRDTSE